MSTFYFSYVNFMSVCTDCLSCRLDETEKNPPTRRNICALHCAVSNFVCPWKCAECNCYWCLSDEKHQTLSFKSWYFPLEQNLIYALYQNLKLFTASFQHAHVFYTHYTPLLYSKTGVYRGILFCLIFAVKHRL